MEDHIQRFRFAQEARAGRATLKDFSFKQPGLAMEVDHEADTVTRTSSSPGTRASPCTDTPRSTSAAT